MRLSLSLFLLCFILHQSQGRTIQSQLNQLPAAPPQTFSKRSNPEPVSAGTTDRSNAGWPAKAELLKAAVNQQMKSAAKTHGDLWNNFGKLTDVLRSGTLSDEHQAAAKARRKAVVAEMDTAMNGHAAALFKLLQRQRVLNSKVPAGEEPLDLLPEA